MARNEPPACARSAQSNCPANCSADRRNSGAGNAISSFRRSAAGEKAGRMAGEGFAGARAPSTVWVLLVVASQLWPLNWFAIWSFSAWFLLVVAALIVVRLFYLTARLLQFRNHLTSGSQKLPPLVQDISKVVSMAIASLVLAAIAPLIEMIIWAGFVESDFFFEANFRLEKDKGGYRQPTGAKSIQVNEK